MSAFIFSFRIVSLNVIIIFIYWVQHRYNNLRLLVVFISTCKEATIKNEQAGTLCLSGFPLVFLRVEGGARTHDIQNHNLSTNPLFNNVSKVSAKTKPKQNKV